MVKPRKGYGSVQTTVIKSEEEYQKFLKEGFNFPLDSPLGLEVEQFVDGPMYHIDGMLSKQI